VVSRPGRCSRCFGGGPCAAKRRLMPSHTALFWHAPSKRLATEFRSTAGSFRHSLAFLQQLKSPVAVAVGKHTQQTTNIRWGGRLPPKASGCCPAPRSAPPSPRKLFRPANCPWLPGGASLAGMARGGPIPRRHRSAPLAFTIGNQPCALAHATVGGHSGAGRLERTRQTSVWRSFAKRGRRVSAAPQHLFTSASSTPLLGLMGRSRFLQLHAAVRALCAPLGGCRPAALRSRSIGIDVLIACIAAGPLQPSAPSSVERPSRAGAYAGHCDQTGSRQKGK